MRRTPHLLVPLLAVLAALLVPAAASAQATPTPAPQSAPTSAATPSPTAGSAPSATPTVTVTQADDRGSVSLAPGGRLEVRLGAAPDAVWEGFETGGPTLHLLSYRSDAQGLSAVLEALSPGRQTLTAQTSPRCRATGPHCGLPSATWSVEVVVTDGPSVQGELPCATLGRATPSPRPGTVVVTAADDGRTVRVAQDGVVQVYLDSCSDPRPAPVRAGAPLHRESVRLDRVLGGQLDAVFRPAATGTTTITAPYDARCLHRTDAAGGGTCAVVQRVFSVTVEVVGGPSTPFPCAKPVYEGFRVSPTRVAAGDPVVVQGGRDDLCVDDAQEPVRSFQLYARPEGGPELLTYEVRARSFRYAEARPTRTTTYRLVMDGRSLPVTDGPATVVVDRTSGSCSTALTLRGPARAVAGTPVVLRGSAAPGETVRVLFRRYGETSFAVRRTVTAGPDGAFSATWTATDDHRWYASTARCDTVPGLTKAAPRITGPAVARLGELVTLRVEAVRGVRTTVFFRAAGEAFSARRTLTGPGTVTYRAERDQRWYALTRDTVSTPGLTQVR